MPRRWLRGGRPCCGCHALSHALLRMVWSSVLRVLACAGFWRHAQPVLRWSSSSRSLIRPSRRPPPTRSSCSSKPTAPGRYDDAERATGLTNSPRSGTRGTTSTLDAQILPQCRGAGRRPGDSGEPADTPSLAGPRRHTAASRPSPPRTARDPVPGRRRRHRPSAQDASVCAHAEHRSDQLGHQVCTGAGRDAIFSAAPSLATLASDGDKTGPTRWSESACRSRFQSQRSLRQVCFHLHPLGGRAQDRLPC